MAYKKPEKKLKPVRVRRVPPTESEKIAWGNFANLVQSLGNSNGLPKIAYHELDRLCRNGNFYALEFKERLNAINNGERKQPIEKQRYNVWNCSASEKSD